MAVNYLHASALITALSFTALQWRMAPLVDKLSQNGLVDGNVNVFENITAVRELLGDSKFTAALLGNFVLNLYIFALLCLKSIFFLQLNASEIRKLVECLFNYVIYKAGFLPLVLTPSLFQTGLWSTWLIVLSSLKMFQILAKERLERLNASPSATFWTYLRVFSTLLFILFADLLWIGLCMIVYRALNASLLLLLFLEPLCIAFETMQAIMVHGLQLLEMWQNHSSENSGECVGSQSSKSAGGSVSEWKGILTRNFGFFLETMTLIMALGHYMMIWWLHGMTFHVVDVALLLNLRALVTAIIKRIKGFIKLRKALFSLNVALPDATNDEISAYDDECAICKEPMSRAKKLSCGHLYHLPCLRSWLDQGLSEVYSCPTCRRPLFPSSHVDSRNARAGEISNGEQHAAEFNVGLDQRRSRGHAVAIEALPNRRHDSSDSIWRGPGLDPGWASPLSSSAVDGAGMPSTVRSSGLSRVQLMMRHLASVSESYAHGALEDTAWNLWPPRHPAGPSVSPSPSLGNNRNVSDLRFRNSPANQNMTEILAMAERIREILPHIPDELIIQDLQQTNNATSTVNNFLST